MTTLSFRWCTRSAIVAVTVAVILGPLVGSAKIPGGDDTGTGQQAYGISASLGKWFLGVVPYVYNSSGAPAAYANDAYMEAVFADAIAFWEGYCNVTFVYGGVDDTADATNNSDGIAVFLWEDIGGAAGRAGPAWTTATLNTFGYWAYLDGSFKLNPNIFTDQGANPGEIIANRESILETTIHELGHLIGLGHSSDPLSIMYANPYNSISHTLEDDIRACREIYGYSNVYSPPPTYQPPAAGSDTYDFLFLTTNNTFPTQWGGVDDGTLSADDTLMLVASNNSPGYSDDLVYVVVDPYGYVSIAASSTVNQGDAFGFGNSVFTRYREIPGTWTMYVYDSTGLLTTIPFSVTTPDPVGNEPPTTEFSFTENPATRSVSVTANVTGDLEGDNATLSWYIPGMGQIDVSPGGNVFSDTRNFTFNDNFDWELWAVVNDDHTRYTEDLPNNIGGAGEGFHSIYRYLSSGLNAGPDMDGDNSSDVVWRNMVTGKNWLYRVKGNLIVGSEQISVEPDNRWNMVGFGDFNSDGKTDILWRQDGSGGNGKNVVYLMDGATILSSTLINKEVDLNWKVAAVADFDGDGDADILWRHALNGKLWMYIMDGTTIQSSVYVGTESDTNWQIFGSGDMNGDGNADLLWRNVGTGWNWVQFMNGATVMSTNVINKEGKTYWNIVGNGDYNGDGFADILWRQELAGGASTGLVWMYLMQGSTIAGSYPVSQEDDLDWRIVSSGDFNSDGYSDILWRHQVFGKSWLFQLNGQTIISSAPLTNADFVNAEADLDWEIKDFN